MKGRGKRDAGERAGAGDSTDITSGIGCEAGPVVGGVSSLVGRGQDRISVAHAVRFRAGGVEPGRERKRVRVRE